MTNNKIDDDFFTEEKSCLNCIHKANKEKNFVKCKHKHVCKDFDYWMYANTFPSEQKKGALDDDKQNA